MDKISVNLLFLILVSLSVIHAHVRLVYPKARTYAFDFLTNKATYGPCGMPENASASSSIYKTKLADGSAITISWRMALVHYGGYRIQILYRNGTVAHELTPTNNSSPWYSTNDTTALNYTTTLPASFTCQHCIIRLIRNILEWSTQTNSYNIWSCADVEINSFNCDKLNCYNSGSMPSTCNNASPECSCNGYKSGDRCQFANECETDTDCNSHGECVTINNGYSYPLKQCYCYEGYFGYKCSRISVLKEALPPNLQDYSYYNDRNLFGINGHMWFKILPFTNEFEVVIRTNTTSWIGLGWRPRGLNRTCQFIPTGAARGLLTYGNSNVSSLPVQFSMDCMDMVIGSARNRTYRIFDYYSRDSSTPRMDTYYGGMDSLTAAIGKEENGWTTLRWRKTLNTTEPTDHTVIDGIMDYVYAVGFDNYVSNSAVAGKYDYYVKDELKYHGNRNRGVGVVNFYGHIRVTATTDRSGCQFVWKAECQHMSCLNELKVYVHSDDTVHFYVTSRTDKWVAIGISDDDKMPATDAVVAWYNNGKTTLTDRYISKYYASPPVDIINNVHLINSSMVNGFFSFAFYRKINTTDVQNDTSLHGCHHFFIAVGGDYNTATLAITKHSRKPIISSSICIDVNKCKSKPNSAICTFTISQWLMTILGVLIATYILE